jgi:hypothetical protein
MHEDRASRFRLEEVAAAKDVGTTGKLTHDYVHRLNGFRCGGGVCRIRIYRGEGSGDAPVVICSELPDGPDEEAANIRLWTQYLAAEVIRDCFPRGLPNLPRPLLWIEQYLTFEGDPQEYSLVSFPFYRPRPAGLGLDDHVVLGAPRREPIGAEDVTRLVT